MEYILNRANLDMKNYLKVIEKLEPDFSKKSTM